MKKLYKKKRHILLFMNKVRTVHSYLSFNKCLYIMFKIFMLSKIIIILITFVNNTGNVHVSGLAYFFFFSFLFFFFEKAMYTAINIEQVMDSFYTFPGKNQPQIMADMFDKQSVMFLVVSAYLLTKMVMAKATIKTVLPTNFNTKKILVSNRNFWTHSVFQMGYYHVSLGLSDCILWVTHNMASVCLIYK